MMNIKEYVMNNATNKLLLDFFERLYIGGLEVVEVDEYGHEDPIYCVPLSLGVRNVIHRTEQEIIQGLIDNIFFYTYTCIAKPVPDNARVYLHIGDKRHLLQDVYRPELYY